MGSRQTCDHLIHDIQCFVGTEWTVVSQALGKRFADEQLHGEKPEALVGSKLMREEVIYPAYIRVRDAARLAHFLLEALDDRRNRCDFLSNRL